MLEPSYHDWSKCVICMRRCNCSLDDSFDGSVTISVRFVLVHWMFIGMLTSFFYLNC
jgi:hypothetical protein